ncbi:MAG TPA: hypothetical protein QF428_01990 [Flavobacteriaceae bacterium]|jgi:hypothetical protein|nr:hypothetical protein [Flavobacteriaceae bacterium]HJO70483.1 hypothetical protein [Flavobacteriaceae bacterium]|tara:strand:+ start:1410 stop:3044 length:1635 start_codon:yes stop_codon:yes gene_type:complete
MKRTSLYLIIFFVSIGFSFSQDNNREELEVLFTDWRQFETPPLNNGAPDYSVETFRNRMPEFRKLRDRLNEIDKSKLDIKSKIDWTIIWAEMNGFEFNFRVLKPWERDPAYYKSVWMNRSDVPAHEGPTHHSVVEIWQYDFPLSKNESSELNKQLRVIPILNEQAKINLTGNAKDLWIAGIRDIDTQISDLQSILNYPNVNNNQNLVTTINEAIESTVRFSNWLKSESSKKDGPSGIGKENYTWYQNNVHLVPLSWDDEVMLLKRELARAWSSLKLEEHKNRNLPKLNSASTPEEYNLLVSEASKELINFLDKEEIVDVKDFYKEALDEHLGSYIPEDKRNFFWITAHLDPKPLFSHFFHWFELAEMDFNPSQNVLRKGPLLYNIFDSRNEGVATAVEEMFMQTGLYENNPRSKEIVYILIAQRAARGLGSLYAHANLMSMEEAGKIHSEYTPRGWMKTEKELLIFEQHLYLRQPGYGTSYITGKYLFENALAEFSRLNENDASANLKSFFSKLINIGSIPITLFHWEINNDSSVISDIVPGLN